IVFLMVFIVSGCATSGSKKEENVTIPKRQYEALLKEQEALRNNLREMQAKYEEERAELLTRIGELQEERETSKIILLNDGKIRYEVVPDAVMDYEELILLKMIHDPEFKTKIEQGGREADIALLLLLREISPYDREITRKEVLGYRKKITKTH
ncbi:MAG: hypothetical protein JRJ29_18590, partial [Deltaproteobacteria bacterium]|nr:hypothetical protein [Deltaproteobacteria bacterium]